MMAPETEPPAPIDDETTEPQPDENVLRVLDREHGDKRIKWKPGDTRSTSRAKARFEKLRAQGYAFFRRVKVAVKAEEFPADAKDGEVVATKKPLTTDLAEYEQVRKFEVEEKEAIAVPPRSGG
jgi:hypothetical protein